MLYLVYFIIKYALETTRVSFVIMDLFQLQRAISDIEAKSKFKTYRPFLGVVNYDLTDDLVKKRMQELCKKASCEKLYFLVVE